jgi:putative two-component system response regulator
MISQRVYKSPIPMAEVQIAMAEQRGRHFDPDLLDSFLGDYESFCAIARAHPDEGVPAAPPAAG